MKHLLAILLMAAAFSANAETVATMPNRAGGITALTTSHSTRCQGQMRVAFGNSADGQRTLFACWTFADGFVFVTWADGTTSSYPLENFTLMEPSP